MTLNDNEYTLAIPVPEEWIEFDEKSCFMQVALESRFSRSEAKTIMDIIESRWPDFAGEDTIVIEVEGYKCLTYITNEFTPIECADKVFPFEGSKTYPMQFIEKKISFKR